MRFSKLFLVVIAVAIVTFSVGLRGQGLVDGIKVTLPEPVTVGDKVLEPGEYEIRRPSSVNRDILQIFNKDKMVYETNVLTVATGPDAKDPKETKVILHHIGDAYYFDKIWMEDKNYGWEFPLPERARALQRETALNVPATRVLGAAQLRGFPTAPHVPLTVVTPVTLSMLSSSRPMLLAGELLQRLRSDS